MTYVSVWSSRDFLPVETCRKYEKCITLAFRDDGIRHVKCFRFSIISASIEVALKMANSISAKKNIGKTYKILYSFML
jgi:hypothetical protein